MSTALRNLNHLRILRLLLRDPNLSRVSEELGLTQPTVSAALAQLRQEFSDPLLVRVGNGMELTARARELVAPVEAAFHAIEGLSQTGDVSPATFKRNIVTATTDYGTVTTVPHLMPRLQKSAPNVSLQFIDMPQRLPAMQRANEIDFHLLPSVLFESKDYFDMKFVPLFKDRFVYVVHKNHRLAGLKKIEEKHLQGERFAIYHLGLEPWNSPLGRRMAFFGENREVCLRLQQFSLLPFAAKVASCVAVMPFRLAEMLRNEYEITILCDSIPSFEFEFCLAWDPLHQHDPVHTWLRHKLREILSKN